MAITKVEIDYNSIIILINELPMLIISIEQLKGVQSWIDGNKFKIEFYFNKGGNIISEFDSFEI